MVRCNHIGQHSPCKGSHLTEEPNEQLCPCLLGEPTFKSPEDGAKYKQKWQAWDGSVGAAWVSRGNPLKRGKTVSSGGVSDAGGSDRLTGLSIVKADSMDAALAIARACPHLEHGTIVVAETMEMGM